MTIDFRLLPVVLILLWLPRQWLRLGTKYIPKGKSRAKDRMSDPRNPGDVSLRFREESAKIRNWIDVVRAAAGAYGVKYACFAVEPGAGKETVLQMFLLQVVILIVAVLIQTIRLEGRFSLAAPVFFVFGVSCATLGWMPTLFAVVAIWMINLVLPNPALFLVGFATLQGVFGVFLARLSNRDVALVVGVTLAPVLFSLLTKRRLIQLNKRTKSVVRQRA